MCNAPTLRYMEVKYLRQRLGGFLGNGISPGAERYQKIAFFVKCQVSMHHSTESDSCQLLHCHTIFFLYIFCHLLIAVLQPGPDILQRICPHAILQPVLPVMIAGCNRHIVLIYQNCLDSGGTKLDSQYCFSICNCILYIAHQSYPPASYRPVSSHFSYPDPLCFIIP